MWITSFNLRKSIWKHWFSEGRSLRCLQCRTRFLCASGFCETSATIGDDALTKKFLYVYRHCPTVTVFFYFCQCFFSIIEIYNCQKIVAGMQCVLSIGDNHDFGYRPLKNMVSSALSGWPLCSNRVHICLTKKDKKKKMPRIPAR